MPAARHRYRPSGRDGRPVVRRELPHPGATLDAFQIRDGCRHQAFTINTGRGQLGVPGGPSSCARPGRGPDTDREGHWPRAPAEQAPERQRGLGRVRPDCRGPARPSPVDAPHLPARAAPRRTQDAADSATAHRRPDHARAAQSVPTPRRTLALGTGPGQSVHPPARRSHSRPDGYPSTAHRAGAGPRTHREH